MKTRSKALLLSLCAVLLVAASVLGTMAYLTDTDTVTNTFTVGQVHLTLDEAKVNKMGQPFKSGVIVEEVKDEDLKDVDRWQPTDEDLEQEYHLLPGHSYTKDPMVTVLKDSENSYIRMVVNVERIDQLKAALPQKDSTDAEIEANKQYYADLNSDATDDFVLEKLLDNSWNYNSWHFASYSESGTTGIYEFRYYTTVDASEATENMKLAPLFTRIKIPGEIDNTHLAHLKDVKVVVNAHAIQVDGFENNEAGAWTAFGNQNP